MEMVEVLTKLIWGGGCGGEGHTQFEKKEKIKQTVLRGNLPLTTTNLFISFFSAETWVFFFILSLFINYKKKKKIPPPILFHPFFNSAKKIPPQNRLS